MAASERVSCRCHNLGVLLPVFTCVFTQVVVEFV